jgi:diguanylate cyclase (GGDEF)-like protein
LAEALRDTAAVLTSTLDFDAVLDRILANVGRVAPHDTAGIMLLEGDHLARVVRSKGYPVRRWEQASQRAVEEWYGLRSIATTGQPLAVPDTAQCADWVATPGSQWVRSYVGAPLRLKRKIIGFINLNSAQPNLFSQRHADNLQAFADQAAIAIENAQLYEASRRYAAEAEALYHASEFLLGPPDNLPALAQQIARAITQDFGMVACSVLWLDESDVALHRLAHAGIPSATAPLGLTLNGPSLPALAARTGDSIYIPDVTTDPRARVDSAYIRSELAIPLRTAGQVLGVLDLQSPEPSAFDEAARRIVSAFAERASLALENARLYQQVVLAADRRAIVYRAAQEIGASLDHEQIGAAIQRAVAQVMPVDRLIIALVSEDRRSLADIYVYDRSRPRWTKARRPLDAGLLGRVVGTGHTYRGAHHAHEDTPPPPGPLLIELRSVMATPLRVGEAVTGALAVYSEGANAYRPDDQMLLEMLAAQTATVLENTRLFQNVQRLANTDPLTRLYNRRHLFDRAQHEYERATRYGRPLSVLMLDIDHFKQINDTFGHAEGDQVLRVVAARCREGLRDVDLVGRYGGEEFAILMPETSLTDARQAAERLRRQVARSPIQTGRNALTITISLGVTTWDGAPNVTLPILLDRADQALYVAKRAGRNCVRLWNVAESKLEPSD